MKKNRYILFDDRLRLLGGARTMRSARAMATRLVRIKRAVYIAQALEVHVKPR